MVSHEVDHVYRAPKLRISDYARHSKLCRHIIHVHASNLYEYHTIINSSFNVLLLLMHKKYNNVYYNVYYTCMVNHTVVILDIQCGNYIGIN